ncbi:hypothetical protein R1sor_020289 [Riccia sorocarpa]|uniref:Calponin-homology (CH) domain-containing protein n=1 Tax=Riccia sorocarpa TaxID=122646 RepID=A0ABD3IJE4_9MARC
MMDVSIEELPLLYSWIDEIPLSRPKHNIARDFSDGVLVAEVVSHYHPKLVDVHNYSAANSFAQKVYNWNTLNVKVFRRLNFSLRKEDIESVANCEPQMIERILKLLKYKMAKYKPNGLKVEAPKVQKDFVIDSQKESRRIEEQYPSHAKNRCLGASSLMRLAQSNQQKEHENRENLRPASQRADSRPMPISPARVHSSQDQYIRAASPSLPRSQEVSPQMLQEKEAHIRELSETIELLEAKVKKLEQLVRLKDHKIQVLSGKLTSKGGRS